MQLKLKHGFGDRVAGRYQKYLFEVGVLDDGPHKEPKTGKRGLKGQDVLGEYAGGPVRKTSTKVGPSTIAEVSAANRERLGFNYLIQPFKNKTSDIIRFSNEFFKIVSTDSRNQNRAVNLLQAIVRNPILRGDYGSNTDKTKKIKGFDRKMIDTAQLFKAIKAICRVKNV